MLFTFIMEKFDLQTIKGLAAWKKYVFINSCYIAFERI